MDGKTVRRGMFYSLAALEKRLKKESTELFDRNLIRMTESLQMGKANEGQRCRN